MIMKSTDRFKIPGRVTSGMRCEKTPFRGLEIWRRSRCAGCFDAWYYKSVWGFTTIHSTWRFAKIYLPFFELPNKYSSSKDRSFFGIPSQLLSEGIAWIPQTHFKPLGLENCKISTPASSCAFSTRSWILEDACLCQLRLGRGDASSMHSCPCKSTNPSRAGPSLSPI